VDNKKPEALPYMLKVENPEENSFFKSKNKNMQIKSPTNQEGT
jgi:hypothetical protein